VSVLAKRTENRQIEILKFIHTRVTEKGYPPTVREIGEAVQLSSTSTVHGHLSRLEKKGLILRDPTKPRAIELTASGLEKIDVQPASIPMLGVVTAGEPILAVEKRRFPSQLVEHQSRWRYNPTTNPKIVTSGKMIGSK